MDGQLYCNHLLLLCCNLLQSHIPALYSTVQQKYQVKSKLRVLAFQFPLQAPQTNLLSSNVSESEEDDEEDEDLVPGTPPNKKVIILIMYQIINSSCKLHKCWNLHISVEILCCAV